GNRQRPPTKVERGITFGEVDTLHQGVDGKDQVPARRYPLNGTVVARAEQQLTRAASGGQRLEELANQLKFAHNSTLTGFRHTQATAQFVQNAVHKLVPLGTTEALGHFDAFVDHHAVRDVNPMFELIGTQTHDG
ncbi:MAG: hypothetical protein AWU57_5024, partial [Marinobacter sp. T13-3]